MHVLTAGKVKHKYTEGDSDIQRRVNFFPVPEFLRKVREPLIL